MTGPYLQSCLPQCGLCFSVFNYIFVFRIIKSLTSIPFSELLVLKIPSLFSMLSCVTIPVSTIFNTLKQFFNAGVEGVGRGYMMSSSLTTSS